MNKMISALALTATVFASGAALAQGTPTNQNNTNTNLADRDSMIKKRDTMIKDKGMMVRVYDKAGKVYYEGQPRYMRRSTGAVGVYFPSFAQPMDESFFDAPDHSERSAN